MQINQRNCKKLKPKEWEAYLSPTFPSHLIHFPFKYADSLIGE